jgi:hypothetical protein
MRKIIINTPEQDPVIAVIPEQPIVNVDQPTTKTSKKKEVPTDETTSS